MYRIGFFQIVYIQNTFLDFQKIGGRVNKHENSQNI